MAIDTRQNLFQQISTRGNQLQRFQAQSGPVLQQLKAAAEADDGNALSDLKALSTFVGSTELGQALGIHTKPEELTPHDYIKVMQAVRSAEPTAAEKAATDKIIKAAAALPKALEAINGPNPTIADLGVAKSALRELFEQDELLRAGGGVHLLSTAAHESLVALGRELGGKFEWHANQVNRFLHGDLAMKELGDDWRLQSEGMGADMGFTAQFKAMAESLRKEAGEIDPNSDWAKTDVQRATKFDDLAKKFADVPLDKADAHLEDLLKSDMAVGDRAELWQAIREQVQLALWQPPTE